MIQFEDGTTLDANDWQRILSLVKQRAKDGKPKPVKIQSDGVTINVRGYDPKPNGKGAGRHAFQNYVESSYKGWKIRVWRIDKDGVYGCNYFKVEEEDVRYLEVRFQDVRDENGVFKYAEAVIDEI